MDNIVPIDPQKLALLKSTGNMPMPYSSDIFLMDSYIAGTGYVEGIEKTAEKLEKGQTLTLRRESFNPYDGLAILVLTQNGEKLGYIPQAKNEVVSHLLDAGKFIFCEIEEIEMNPGWPEIYIKVFMRDF